MIEEECEEIHRRCCWGKNTEGVKDRLSSVLLADEGLVNPKTSEHLPLTTLSVGRWRMLFFEGGIEAIKTNKPRSFMMNPGKNAEYDR